MPTIKSVTAGTDSGGSATVSVTTSESPSATVAGDPVLVIHSNDFYALSNMAAPTATGTPTMNAIAAATADGGTNLGHIKCYWYVANTGGAQTISTTETGTHDEEKGLVAVVFDKNDTDTATFVDTATSSVGAPAASHTVPSTSPSTAANVIVVDCTGGGSAPTGYTCTAPLTEQLEYAIVGLFRGVVGANQRGAPGATGTYTITPASSVNFQISVVAVMAATGGGGGSPAPFIGPPGFMSPMAVASRVILGDRSTAAVESYSHPAASSGTATGVLAGGKVAAGAVVEAVGAAESVAGRKLASGTATVQGSGSDRPAGGKLASKATTEQGTATDAAAGRKIAVKAVTDQGSAAEALVTAKRATAGLLEGTLAGDVTPGSKTAAAATVEPALGEDALPKSLTVAHPAWAQGTAADRPAGLKVAVGSTRDQASGGDVTPGRKLAVRALADSAGGAELGAGRKLAAGSARDQGVGWPRALGRKLTTGATRAAGVAADVLAFFVGAPPVPPFTVTATDRPGTAVSSSDRTAGAVTGTDRSTSTVAADDAAAASVTSTDGPTITVTSG